MINRIITLILALTVLVLSVEIVLMQKKSDKKTSMETQGREQMVSGGEEKNDRIIVNNNTVTDSITGKFEDFDVMKDFGHNPFNWFTGDGLLIAAGDRKFFTVMTFGDAHKDVLSYMGSHSGRDEDKAKALGLHTAFTENGTPYYEEAEEVYECEIIYHSIFDTKGFAEMPKKFYADFPAGVHSQYIGKIVKAMKRK